MPHVVPALVPWSARCRAPAARDRPLQRTGCVHTIPLHCCPQGNTAGPAGRLPTAGANTYAFFRRGCQCVCPNPMREPSMSQRIDYMKQSPELCKKFVEFTFAAEKSSIEPALHDLVVVRASQVNGCAFCVDMHVKQATMHGERPLRLYHLPIWRESPLFNPRE